MMDSLLPRARGALCRLACTQQVRTNQDTGLIRLIACLCMCIDHAGKMLFPQLTVMHHGHSSRRIRGLDNSPPEAYYNRKHIPVKE